VAQGVDQARQQRELIKQQLAADAARVEARIRGELDWRARLRRDGPRLVALGAGAVILIGTIVLVRSRLRRDHDVEEAVPASLEEVAAELRAIRSRLGRRGGDASPVWQKALLRGVAAAGAAGGTYAAKRLIDQQAGDGKGRAGATGGG
jgi:hypothetical protein